MKVVWLINVAIQMVDSIINENDPFLEVAG